MLPGFAPMHAEAGSSLGNDAYTKLLLHFEGAAGAQSGPGFVDSSLSAKGSGTNAGASAISTTQFKFGSSSFNNAANGYITFPNHADWNFDSQDFTIDYWSWRNAGGTIIARDLPTTFSPFIILNSGSGDWFFATSTGSSWDIASQKAIAPTNPAATWYHGAVTRQGSTWRTFFNGVKQQEWTSSAAIITNSNALCIGACQNGNNNNGYTDELRISKGIARWTVNFTPPTAPYS